MAYQQSLTHHGVKGQKWGVRRYQNKDGSYTPAGKKRRLSIKESVRNATSTAKEKKHHVVSTMLDKQRDRVKKKAARMAYDAMMEEDFGDPVKAAKKVNRVNKYIESGGFQKLHRMRASYMYDARVTFNGKKYVELHTGGKDEFVNESVTREMNRFYNQLYDASINRAFNEDV